MGNQRAAADQGHPNSAAVPRAVSAAIGRFLERHGGSANAVIEPVGRVGVRLTLVGSDGVLGDQVLANTAAAQAVIDAFPQLELAAWDRTLTSTATTRKGHNRKMAGWLTGCARSVRHVIGCRVTRRIKLGESKSDRRH
ncbi:hypothetical protein [Skermania sp. ID1734]|uniref:hypothetical protein n=1 Tax=Skermania sp. ID1734 TaxID=2597516 RepID=UPI0021078976|nr:hypothetical protein [Skermania sp. ID1734]